MFSLCRLESIYLRTDYTYRSTGTVLLLLFNKIIYIHSIKMSNETLYMGISTRNLSHAVQQLVVQQFAELFLDQILERAKIKKTSCWNIFLDIE